MIDQRFMQSLADDMKDPMLGEETAPEMLLAAGPARTDAPQAFVGTRLNVPRAGQPQPTTQDRERLAVGLLDSLAGALRGAAAQTLGLPGDIRSIIDMINQEGAEKYLGQRSFATTEEILKDTSVRIPGTTTDVPFPPVLGADVPRREERQPSVETAQEVGTFLPAPGIPEAVIRGGKAIGRAVQATKNMPVGMSTQMVGEGISDLGFYSAAKQAVDSIQQPKGTGEQFLKQIEKTPGVKPEEIKWTGLDDFLKSKKSVTKAEVQEFLDKNRVEIKEVRLNDVDEAELQAFLNDEAGQGFTRQEAIDYLRMGMDAPTKFSKYTLPGGENYREILITLPTREQGGYILGSRDGDTVLREFKNYDQAFNFYQSQPQSDRLATYIKPKNTSPEFKSQHFEQPNILAHMRVNDRVDADGKKVLFIEEVQSDWHQAGRKTGYKDEALINKNIEEQRKSVEEKTKALEDAKPYTDKGMDAPQEIIERFTMADDRLNALRKEEIKLKGAIPDAPFKTTWHELAMKRAIQLAAEGGYDRVAFTTGKTQAERYDLSKEISRITYTEAGVLRAYDKSDNMVLSKKLESPDQIEDYIGKEPAKKLLEKEVGKVSVDKKYTGPGMEFDGRELSGVDLQIGGEGMKGFYDQILPKFLDKYAKKWDAKTGMTKIQTESKAQAMADANLLEELGTPRDKIDTSGMVSVQYIDVTPKMKESVLTKGQPLFAIGAGGAAVQQEENE